MDELGRINYPDVQFRIAKSGQGVRWEGHVHETLTGPGIKTTLPFEPEYAILHYKNIDRQRKQNLSYETGNYENK